MLPIHIFPNQNGVVLRAEGSLTSDELIQARDMLLHNVDQLATLGFLLFDLRDAMLAELTTSDLLDLARVDQALARYTPPGMAVAIVAQRDLEYGLARMWEAFVAGKGWETMVFRSRKEAEHWIRERVQEKFETTIGEFPDAWEV